MTGLPVPEKSVNLIQTDKHARKEMDMKAIMEINQERCKGCGLCVSVCPLHIMQIDRSVTNQKGYHPAANTDIAKCIACGNCAVTCPDAVITLEKE